MEIWWLWKNHRACLLSQTEQGMQTCFPCCSPDETRIGIGASSGSPGWGDYGFCQDETGGAALSKMMQACGWRKSYLTVLWGTLEEKSGTWTDYLFKNARTNLSEVVSASRKGAKKAILHYQVLAETMWNEQPLSLVEITLETGRHHQIRVQTSHHGAPIWGDRKYNTLQPMRDVGNMALWSWKLEGKWEKQKEGFSIRSLPSDMPFSLFSEKLGEL